MLVALCARRFFCDHPGCQKGTYAEQTAGPTVRHGRRTASVQQTVQAVAMALGGRAGARLVERVAAPVSRSTLLRVIRAVPNPPVAGASSPTGSASAPRCGSARSSRWPRYHCSG